MSTEDSAARPPTRRELIAAERARAAAQQPSAAPDSVPDDGAPPPLPASPPPGAAASTAERSEASAAVGAASAPPQATAPATASEAATAPASHQPEAHGSAAPEPATAEPPAARPEPTPEPRPAVPAEAALRGEPAAPTGPDGVGQKKPSRPRRILRGVASAVVLVVLCLSLLIGVSTIVVPAVGGGTALTVQTSSMEPTYPPGTMVIIRPTPASEIKPGDVITYQLKSGEPEVVTHRVTQQLRTADGAYRFITKGDNNPSPDPAPIQEVQLKGKLWYAVPWVGYLSSGLSGPWRGLVVPVAVGLLFAYAAWMFISSARDKRRRTAREEARA